MPRPCAYADGDTAETVSEEIVSIALSTNDDILILDPESEFILSLFEQLVGAGNVSAKGIKTAQHSAKTAQQAAKATQKAAQAAAKAAKTAACKKTGCWIFYRNSKL